MARKVCPARLAPQGLHHKACTTRLGEIRLGEIRLGKIRLGKIRLGQDELC